MTPSENDFLPNDGDPVGTVGLDLTDSWGRLPRGQLLYRPAEDLAEDDPTLSSDPDANPLAQWASAQGDLILLVGDQRLFLIPANRIGMIVPPARLANIDWRQVAVQRELGPLLGLPPVGAGASRLFKAGPRLGVMLDAGRNPQRQQGGVVYMDHLTARARDLGVREVRAIVLIHRHSDHANEIPAVVRQYGITANNVFIPRAFQVQQGDAAYNRTIQALRQIFGASWQPADIRLQPANPSGTLVKGRYTLGDVSYEFLADSAALRLPRHSDSASLLTRVTRRGDLNPTVVLGDLRGADLETFHRRMGADAWREYFRNVLTIDGFSHHRGRLDARDVPGIMRLLEATLLQNGRLVVTLQTDPGQAVQARADTLEFMRRIGIEVHETHVGAAGRAGGIRATTRGATTTGAAQSHAPIPSGLTQAVARINQLKAARDTVALWGPHISRVNPNFNQTAELRQIDQSLGQLRSAARTAVEAAAQVRTSGQRLTGAGAGLNYSGGTQGSVFTTAIGAIPAATLAETAIGPAGFAQLARLQRIPAAQVPLVVALNDALINGRYSREAFRYMVSQLDPATRRSIFTGRRGGPTTDPQAIFQRLRAEFGFRQAMSGGMYVMSAGHLRPGVRGGARGVAGLLAIVELGNLVAQGVQSYRVAQSTAARRNIAPFLRRIAFWRQLRAQPSAVAIKDPTLGSTTYERNPTRIDTGLANNDYDFLFIEHTAQNPALPDAEILQAIAVLGYNVRNYDEYATLFEDSGQDAVRFVLRGGMWWESEWQVRVGRFNTSGTNSVDERWEHLPLLSEGMNAFVRRVVENTRVLLGRLGRGQDPETPELGSLQTPHGSVMYRARLKPGVTKTIVELRVNVPAPWSGAGSIRKIYHEITWPTNRRVEFLVWRVDGVDVHVSGANFETYARLRDLRSEEYYIGTRGTTLNAVLSRPRGNDRADGWILTTEIERI